MVLLKVDLFYKMYFCSSVRFLNLHHSKLYKVQLLFFIPRWVYKRDKISLNIYFGFSALRKSTHDIICLRAISGQ